MEYDEIASNYLTAPEQPIQVLQPTHTPARRLRDALEPIGTQGWWSRGVHERLSARGMSFFEAYVWGRAAALGTPAASVVVSAFGVFEPGFLTGVYESGRVRVSREEVLQAREHGAAENLAAVLGDAEVAPLADALLEAVQSLDGCARPLFSGLRELPVPADPHGRLWRGAELVREHRGDGHLAACVAAGLDAVSMNVMTELWLGYSPGEYSGTRGFDEAALAASLARLAERGWVSGAALTDDGRRFRVAIEDATDVSQQPLIDNLGDQLDRLIEWATALSARIIERQSFPSDPRKRAAG